MRLLHARDAHDGEGVLDTTARPTRAEIASAISGNLCRCTGYTAIYEAIEKAAQRV